MNTIFAVEGFQLLEYKPTLLKPLAITFEPIKIVRRIRFLYEFLHKNKYRVYYLAKDGVIVGYCVVTPGGRRLKASNSEDIVLGPYYIDEVYRNKGYAKQMISMVLDSIDFRYAFDWIDKNNMSSIKVTEDCGFRKIGEIDVSRYLRKVRLVNTGANYLFVFKKDN